MRRSTFTTGVLTAVALAGLVPSPAAAATFPRTVERDGRTCTLFLDMHGDVQEQCPGRPLRPLLRKGERREVPGWPQVVTRGDAACLQYVAPEGGLWERCPDGDHRMLESRWMDEARGARRHTQAAAPAEAGPPEPVGPAYGDVGSWDLDLLFSLSSRSFTDPYDGPGRMQVVEAGVSAGHFVAPGLRVWGGGRLSGWWGDSELATDPGVTERSLAMRGGVLLLLDGPSAPPRPEAGALSALGLFVSAALEVSTALDRYSGMRPGGAFAAGLRGPLAEGVGGDLRLGVRVLRLDSGELVRVWDLSLGLFGFVLPR